LQRGAAGGGALLLSSSAVSAFAGSAAAATVPDNDLSYLRLLIGAELLAADFQTQALGSGKLAGAPAGLLKRMLADEQEHYHGLANLMTGAGQVPATADDINFAYPRGSFDSTASIIKLARTLEDLTLGAYLGAVQNVQTAQMRLPIGQIAANEAQHVSALAVVAGRAPIGRAFAPSLQIGAVSAALDAYES
jgi:hypothetical protein